MSAAETQIWYVEELIGGKFVPVTYLGAAPKRKRLSGRNRVFRSDPVLVDRVHKKRTLNELFDIYSPDGRLYSGDSAR